MSVHKMVSGMKAWQARLKYATLPEVTITASKASSLIAVPKQRVYTGRMPVISSTLAGTSCASLGTAGLLAQLNATLGTSYTMDTALSSLLEVFISNDDDFGTAYGLVRPLWYDSWRTIQDELRTRELKDREKRKSAFLDDRICNPQMPPRRLWDLYSNRVVPQWIAPESRWKAPWAISHAWMNIKDRIDVMTPINGNEWPVPIPKDTDLDLVRIEMLNLGAEYVWLDVLCLRQRGGLGEDLRGEEWRLDVPTIGHVYRIAEKVVCYFSGLGRPLGFTESDFESDRCWFRRAWTLQEISGQWIIGGDMDGEKDLNEDVLAIFQEQLASLENIMPITGAQCTDNLFAVLMHMQKRVSENPVDKVAGLACLLESDRVPAYYEMQSLEDAWSALVDVMRGEYRGQVLLWYPEPGKGRRKWRPSWEQIMTEPLPIYESPLREDVHRDEEADTDWYEGITIEKGHVRGLAKGDTESNGRRGELVVQDGDGTNHTFKITATHRYPIPEDFYTLISGQWELGYWAVGRRTPDQRFEKVSTFRMYGRTEGIQRLAKLGVGKWSRIFLS